MSQGFPKYLVNYNLHFEIGCNSRTNPCCFVNFLKVNVLDTFPFPLHTPRIISLSKSWDEISLRGEGCNIPDVKKLLKLDRVHHESYLLSIEAWSGYLLTILAILACMLVGLLGHNFKYFR
jgi:hypothetical protein